MRAISTGGPKTVQCPRCGAQRLSPVVIAEQADALHAIIEGAVALDLATPADGLTAAYGSDIRRVQRAIFARAANLALAHARAIACLAGACLIGAANEEMEHDRHTDLPDAGRQFVLLLVRDGKVQAQKIAEAEILRRYEGYEFVRG
jgi:hypothetical protein